MNYQHALPDTAQETVHALPPSLVVLSLGSVTVGLVPRSCLVPVKPSFSHGSLSSQFRLCLLKPTAPCIFDLFAQNESP
mgnify:CR=1 FL=1